MTKIPVLERKFKKACPYPFRLHPASYRGDRKIRGSHLTMEVPLESVAQARRDLARLLDLVEKYYGKVADVEISKTTYFYSLRDDMPSHREFRFIFKDKELIQ